MTPFALPIEQLCGMQKTIRKAEVNIAEGRPTRSAGTPIRVSELPSGRYMLIDGHHRTVQAVRDEAVTIEAVCLDPPMPCLAYWDKELTPVTKLVRV